MEEINEGENYEENCRKEMLKLKREIKIGKLLLYQKKNELKEQIEQNEKLKIDFNELYNKIKEISKNVRDYDLQNKNMEYDINSKIYEKQKLFNEINEEKLVPIKNYAENNDDFNYENYEILIYIKRNFNKNISMNDKVIFVYFFEYVNSSLLYKVLLLFASLLSNKFLFSSLILFGSFIKF